MTGNQSRGFFDLMNRYGAEGEPFFFIVDFEMNHPEIYKLKSVPAGIKYSTPLLSNCNNVSQFDTEVSLNISPVTFSSYAEAFKNVQEKNIGN